MTEHLQKGLHDEIEAVLMLADLPRPDGEKHDMDPPHDLCLGDDPCVCIQLMVCEQRVANKIAALLVEGIDWRDGFTAGLDAAEEAVRAALGADERDLHAELTALAAIDALREKQ